jgi:hypothetical protein
MNIKACNPDGGAFKYILDGIGNAFKAAGFKFTNVRSARNTRGGVVDTNFDLYLGCSGWRQHIPPRSKRKGLVGIHVNPYGRKKVGAFPPGPTIDEQPEAINWTVTQKPDFVFCYCTDHFIDDYYGFWTSRHGIPVVPMATAADITIYRPSKVDARFNCDIGWVGGYWAYKALMLDPYLKPLIKKYNSKVFGWGGWGRGSNINDNDVPKLFASAKVCPSVSEIHTSRHPIDVPERVFKVPACGGFTIHTPSPAIPAMFGSAVPMASNPKNWFELIDHYINDDRARKEQALKQYKVVMDHHTYFDRCIGIANAINDETMKTKLLEAKATYRIASENLLST